MAKISNRYTQFIRSFFRLLNTFKFGFKNAQKLWTPIEHTQHQPIKFWRRADFEYSDYEDEAD